MHACNLASKRPKAFDRSKSTAPLYLFLLITFFRVLIKDNIACCVAKLFLSPHIEG